MYNICCVTLPRSAAARLRKVSLQLPYLSAFPLIKRVFRDALYIILTQKSGKVNTLPLVILAKKSYKYLVEMTLYNPEQYKPHGIYSKIGKHMDKLRGINVVISFIEKIENTAAYN